MEIREGYPPITIGSIPIGRRIRPPWAIPIVWTKSTPAELLHPRHVGPLSRDLHTEHIRFSADKLNNKADIKGIPENAAPTTEPHNKPLTDDHVVQTPRAVLHFVLLPPPKIRHTHTWPITNNLSINGSTAHAEGVPWFTETNAALTL